MSTGLIVVLAVVYVAVFLTLGVTAIRKGHWLWFVVGIVVPGLLADRRAVAAQGRSGRQLTAAPAGSRANSAISFARRSGWSSDTYV